MIHLPSKTAMLSLYMFISMPYTIARAICMHDYDMLPPSHGAGSESCPPMLNKENYVPWSSRLLRYAKSRPNGKLIHNSILNGPYVRRMILEPGDANRDVNMNETFHEQTDDELSKKELKQIKADDQAIQIILLGHPEYIYAAVDNTMVEMNIPANDAPAEQAPAVAPPTKIDDKILPSSKWVPIGKSNCILEILWAIIHRSNIDYAERIWEELVQSIQTFLTDRKNLTMASCRKKKTTHLLILSVRFTKLTIHHLKTKHNVHLRTGSPLYYSHDENVLKTLMFVGKDGREIFGMLIPDALLTDEIKGAPYYDEYHEHVAKYQQYLDAEHGKAPKLTSTQPPKPKPAPTQPSKAVPEKKQKVVKETPNEPSPAKRSKGGLSHTLMPTEAYGHAKSPSLDAKLALTDSETKSDNVVPKINTRDQDEGQTGPNPGNHDEGQVGRNPGVQDEGQARSNPGDAAESQPKTIHVVHAGPNLEHIDLEAIDALTQ
nr:hypothetical protein [Tanacetum cinerariifolium]